jgi:galactitol-specific phosphotransferase system IIB component
LVFDIAKNLNSERFVALSEDTGRNERVKNSNDSCKVNSVNHRIQKQHLIAKIKRLKRKLDDEVKKNKRTRMFTYMIIHDIKHPTESLINSLNEIVACVKD